MQNRYTLIATVAAFLKDRDEAFIMSEEQTDEERAGSAEIVIDLLAPLLQGEPSTRAQAFEEAAQAVEKLANTQMNLSLADWSRISADILSAIEVSAGDCHCTKIQQDETCPVGYPSLLCEICDGKGVVSPPRALALEDTGNPVNYDHAEAMQVLAKCACKVCGGTGERNDADCGDLYFNTWVCDGCDGQGWNRQAYFEAFPVLRALSSQTVADGPFQDRVKPWMLACFGEEISNDKLERCDRFIEEALELVQAIGYSTERAHALVDYVFNRDIGEPHQEVGGVMVTLAALCLASGLDMNKAAEDELARVWTKVEKIRAKQAAKPTGSALPIALPASPGASE